MDAQFLAAMVGGLGVGSLLTTAVQSYLSGKTKEKERSFAEKKESYIGFLRALSAHGLQQSEGNTQSVALWRVRLTLVGSPGVVKCALDMVGTKPDEEFRNDLARLVLEMRNDLGVDVRELEKSY